MKVRKGEVVIAISPKDLPKYRKSGWKVVQEPTPEQIARYNENARLKRMKRKEEEDVEQP